MGDGKELPRGVSDLLFGVFEGASWVVGGGSGRIEDE